MQKINKHVIIYIILIVSIVTFLFFGLYHLGKFETTDEHLWKYDRIGAYWNALETHDWINTYINDKPGITVALVSGIGLLSEPHPENNEYLADTTVDTQRLYEKYDSHQTEVTNFRFRLPVLIFSTLALFGFFYLAYVAFKSLWIALFTTVFIATNSILLGMSQIINPDSFFWIFGGLATLSYIALINTQKLRFLFLCGIFTGFALLSKYTAFILFLFFGLAAVSKMIFQKPEDAKKTTWKAFFTYFGHIFIIFILSMIIFAVFLPAVFIEPNYLFKGISQFLNVKTVFLGIIIFAFLGGIAFFRKKFIGTIIGAVATKRNIITLLTTSLFSLLLIISFVNVWTGQKFAPIDEMRDLAYANEPREFSFKPLIDKRAVTPRNNIQFYLMESYPLIFSLSPFFIVLIFTANYLAFRKKLSDHSAFIINAIIIFVFLYIYSTLYAKVVTNVRYSIILYPILAIFGAVTLREALHFFKYEEKKHLVTATIVIFAIGLTSLFLTKPFYFSYTNFLLPKDFSIHDSWGHGAYEAAQYLNAMPDAQNLVIWSNSDTVCRFFYGKCLRSRKIDLSVVIPDYFVLSKRGVLKEKNHFILLNNPENFKDTAYYFTKLDHDYVWGIDINNRPDNFIKIIKFEN